VKNRAGRAAAGLEMCLDGSYVTLDPMNSGRALTLFLALTGALLTYTGVRYARLGGSPRPEVTGDGVTLRFFKDARPVAAFAATTLDGQRVSSDTFKGKVVIVNFWATWCPPCRAEIPDLVALQDKYRDTLQIIGISEDEGPVEEVQRFAAEHRINYPIVMSTKEITALFPGVQALPTSFVLNREGLLVQKHVGMLSAETTELEARALAGLPVNAAVEYVDRAEGLKLANNAQLMEIPGVDLASLPAPKRTEALQKLNAQACTCGCDLTVAKCRVDDPSCGVSLPIAKQIVQQIAAAR
jgi:thiol-disulfide isomerase/thioredoxin